MSSQSLESEHCRLTSFTGLLIVSAIDFRILFSVLGLYPLLGYTTEEMAGSDLRMLCGPLTNVELLHSCIMAQRPHITLLPAIQLILYTKQLNPRTIMIQTSTFSSLLSSQHCCALCLATSEALLLSDAMQSEHSHPRALILPNDPYFVVFYNAAFSSAFGIELTLPGVVALPFQAFASAQSDPIIWSRLMSSSSHGLVSESTFPARTASCPDRPFKLRCEPVVLGANGQVAFIAATLDPHPPEAASRPLPPAATPAP